MSVLSFGVYASARRPVKAANAAHIAAAHTAAAEGDDAGPAPVPVAPAGPRRRRRRRLLRPRRAVRAVSMSPPPPPPPSWSRCLVRACSSPTQRLSVFVVVGGR